MSFKTQSPSRATRAWMPEFLGHLKGYRFEGQAPFPKFLKLYYESDDPEDPLPIYFP